MALIASGLTFFSGFGLGTLLLPAFAVFFPVEVAVALTAIVHFLNGVFKLVLVGRHAKLGIALRFGIPAVFAAFLGARVLAWVSDLPAVARYEVAGRMFSVMPIKLLIAIIMMSQHGGPGSRSTGCPISSAPTTTRSPRHGRTIESGGSCEARALQLPRRDPFRSKARTVARSTACSLLVARPSREPRLRQREKRHTPSRGFVSMWDENRRI